MAERKIISKPGVLGTTIHYNENNEIIGKSVAGAFGSGALVHYDAAGKCLGKTHTTPTGNMLHYDGGGNLIGKSMKGPFDSLHHYDAAGNRIGSSKPGPFGSIHTQFDSAKIVIF